ncbi:MAG: hypothetical protein M1823_000174 [Watsoniomyces obsoletus]|nr:MAG: hypothetical protein M1823_000174 [Watsoniomyces obsoletus]
MALDKQPSTHRPTRPLIATLNAPNKTIKTPLTPRLAAPLSSPRSPAVYPHPQSSPPKDTTTDYASTPVKAFLSSNITPRSGSRNRKARTETANSTPTGPLDGRPNGLGRGVKNISDSPSTPTQRPLNGAPRGINSRPTSVVGEARGSSRRASPERMVGQSMQTIKTTSPFFHASNAKSAWDAQKSPSELSLPPKESNFFYANGDRLETLPTLPTSPTASHISSRPGTRSGPEGGSISPRSPTKSTISSREREWDRRRSSARPDVKEDTKRFSGISLVRADEPHSPVGEASTSPVSNGVTKETSPKHALLGQILSEVAAVEINHRKSLSMGSLEVNAFKHRIQEQDPTSKRASISIPESSPPPLHSEQLHHHVSVITTNEDQDHVLAPPFSPTTIPDQTAETSSKCRLQQADELAASARRERKVLDLEISNSSLMAINRTLERKMRKQNAELRRFRRLSRSGRLSLATTGSAATTTSLGFNRSISLNGVDELPEPGSSDIEEEEDEDSLLSPPISSDESLDEGDDSLSPNAMAESDARHQAQDEKRLQIDLVKHQRLLVDSHKMNESLKRCLGWTEELINEGKKALEFRVRVSDIEFGGRVLVRDDLDENETNSTQVDEEEGEEGMSTPSSKFLRTVREENSLALRHRGTVGFKTDGDDDHDGDDDDLFERENG